MRKYSSCVGRELVDELDEVAGAVLIEILRSEIRELILRLYIVDGYPSFLYEILYEEEPDGDMLCPWAKPVSHHVQRGCVIDVNRNALESLLEA